MNDAFSEEYDQYGAMLYKIAFLYFGNAADSEDAMQEVFIKLLYKAPAFQSEEHEKAWLIRTMQYTCLNMLRHASRKTAALDEATLVTDGEDDELKLDILNAVLALPPKYKAVIYLFYYDGYSVSEIARTLKTSESAVKMRLKRGREQLKKSLEGYGNETK